GWRVAVVDAPDLSSTNVSGHWRRRAIDQCVNLSAPGPHAFLLVLPLGGGAGEAWGSLERGLEMFGEEKAESHAMILFTRGEELKGKTPEEFVQQGGRDLRRLVQKCGHRWHVLRAGKTANRVQVTGLLEKIEEMLQESQGSFYSNLRYWEVEESIRARQRQIMKERYERDLNRKQVELKGKYQREYEEWKGDSSHDDWTKNMLSSNTILGGSVFESEYSITSECQKREGMVAGRRVAVVEVPDLFHAALTRDKTLAEKCLALCSPGPHAFLLVVRVGKLTTEEEDALEVIRNVFGEAALKHTMILFSHGDELKGQHVEESGDDLKKLLEKCSNRHHVLNNKNVSDRLQVTQLLEKIDRMVEENAGWYYTKNIYQETEGAIRLKEQQYKEKYKEMLEEKEEVLRKLQKKAKEMEGLRVMLMGMAGAGKTAAANTILGRAETSSEAGRSQVAQGCVKRIGTMAGRRIVLIDSPDLLGSETWPKETGSEIRMCMLQPNLLPNVFLLVLQIGDFRAGEEEALQIMKDVFGETFRNYTLILFTHGDRLGGETIEQYLREQPPGLQKLLHQCGRRYHVFNNEDMGNRRQVEELLGKIDEMWRKSSWHGQDSEERLADKAQETAVEGQMGEITQKHEQEMEELRQRYEREKERETEPLRETISQEQSRLEQELRVKYEEEIGRRETELREEQRRGAERHQEEQAQRERELTEGILKEMLEWKQKYEELQREMEEMKKRSTEGQNRMEEE
uniref:AIG1-type G domain-containing protein n=1 Tax=Lepisosteus oculatus TaxID=7918 RepID=W5NL90_LEPOC